MQRPDAIFELVFNASQCKVSGSFDVSPSAVAWHIAWHMGLDKTPDLLAVRSTLKVRCSTLNGFVGILNGFYMVPRCCRRILRLSRSGTSSQDLRSTSIHFSQPHHPECHSARRRDRPSRLKHAWQGVRVTTMLMTSSRHSKSDGWRAVNDRSRRRQPPQSSIRPGPNAD
jgi:hypothetical protein